MADRTRTKKAIYPIQFFDTNYQLAEFEEQNGIFSKYCDLINYFDNTVTFQLTFENQNRSQDGLVKQIQIPAQEDDFNEIRAEYSEMLTSKLLSGKNGQSCRKFLTFTIEANSYKQAKPNSAFSLRLSGKKILHGRFQSIDREFSASDRQIYGFSQAIFKICTHSGNSNTASMFSRSHLEKSFLTA